MDQFQALWYRLRQWLFRPLWGEYSAFHILLAVLLVALALHIVQRIAMHIRSKRLERFTKYRCSRCHWELSSPFPAKRCPKCDSPNMRVVRDP